MSDVPIQASNSSKFYQYLKSRSYPFNETDALVSRSFETKVNDYISISMNVLLNQNNQNKNVIIIHWTKLVFV